MTVCVPFANRANAPCGLCGSITDVCMKPASKGPEYEKHDPLARRLPGEPYWPALARDHLAPFMPDIYACALLRNWGLLDAVVQNLKDHMNSVEPRPHKDQDHAWSSRAKATEMRQWRLDNMPTQPVRGRVNLNRDVDAPDFSAIKRAVGTSIHLVAAAAPAEDFDEVVCQICDGVVHPNPTGMFPACGAPTCPFANGVRE